MTSQPRKQTIATHILPNISKKKKGYQTMKFGQLTWQTFALKKSYSKCGGETIRRPFS